MKMIAGALRFAASKILIHFAIEVVASRDYGSVDQEELALEAMCERAPNGGLAGPRRSR